MDIRDRDKNPIPRRPDGSTVGRTHKGSDSGPRYKPYTMRHGAPSKPTYRGHVYPQTRRVPQALSAEDPAILMCCLLPQTVLAVLLGSSDYTHGWEKFWLFVFVGVHIVICAVLWWKWWREINEYNWADDSDGANQ